VIDGIRTRGLRGHIPAL